MKIDPDLQSFSMWRAILMFRHRVDLLNRWSREVRIKSLPDKATVRTSMRRVCELWEREQNPPPVDPELGWSPYLAKKFLEKEGIVTEDYHDGGGNWYASSPYQEIGAGTFPDNIAYYVDGTEHAATQLKLILNVNNPTDPSASELKFRKLVLELIRHALSGDFVISQNCATEFAERDHGEMTVGDKKLSISIVNWTAGIRNGYERRFVIEHHMRGVV